MEYCESRFQRSVLTTAGTAHGGILCWLLSANENITLTKEMAREAVQYALSRASIPETRCLLKGLRRFLPPYCDALSSAIYCGDRFTLGDGSFCYRCFSAVHFDVEGLPT